MVIELEGVAGERIMVKDMKCYASDKGFLRHFCSVALLKCGWVISLTDKNEPGLSTKRSIPVFKNHSSVVEGRHVSV